MASHHITIAKASLSASLLRPDPVSVARDDITYFHTSLDRALSHCSPANIQTCKSWLLNNVIPSSNRVGGLGKYLGALSGSFTPASPSVGPNKPARNNGSNVSTSKVSAKRKRLHILYLLNDLLHHTKYHGDTSASFSTLSGSLQPSLVELFGLAAAFEREKNPKHHKRLNEILDIWAENGYYSEEYVTKLRGTVENSASVDAIEASLASSDEKAGAEKALPVKDAPFVMPATHGDPSTPYHDLPAGNLMPHIIPNSTTPIRPDAVKPLQFLAGPADANLVKAVKTFLKDADKLYDTSPTTEDEGVAVDIDALGQMIARDKVTGEIIGGESYYGWSLDFCQKMKKRREEGNRSRSQSRDRSQSSSPRKRRRYSDSVSSRGRSPSRERSRCRRTYPDSQSPPPRATRHRTRSRSASRSESRSYSPEAPSKSQQRSSFPPPPPPPVSQMPFNGDQSFKPPPPSLGPGGLPVPPPPPPNYQGPWPPPPPPAAPSHSPPQPGGFPNMPMNMNMNMNMNVNMPNFPSPHFQQHQHQRQGGQFSPPAPPPPMHQAQGQMQMPMQPGNFPFPPPFGQAPQQQQQQHNQEPWRQGQMGNGGSSGGGRGGYYPSSRGRGRGWH